MKTFMTTCLFLGLTLTANASTVYKGIIDLTEASNNAKYPTTINAGLYSVAIEIEASKKDAIDNIIINRAVTHERDGNIYTCTTSGSFEVGKVTIHLKDLKGQWQSTTSSKLVVNFEASENGDSCTIDTATFEGARLYRLHLPNVKFELPVNDPRFNKVSLAVNPINEGIQLSYDLQKGSSPATLKVLNAGSELTNVLEVSGDQKVAHALSLEGQGYYHFDTELSAVKKEVSEK